MCNFFDKRKIVIVLLCILACICSGLCGVYGFARLSYCDVDGINITGCNLEGAEKKIEKALTAQLKQKKLVLQVEEKQYIFRYPQLYYQTDIKQLLPQIIGKSGRFTLQKKLCLTNLEESLRGICDAFYRQSIDSTVLFHGRVENLPVFQYTRDRDGRFIDGIKLKKDVENALKADWKKEYFLHAKTIYKSASLQLQEAKKATQLISRFSTYFATTNAERSHNINLASQLINGMVLQPNDTFSFNDRVGARTKERGFREAHIIQEGEFVNGVGGGVCQVSTTVYNCALLAGLKIVEYHPHSLHVGYVPPSFDAMVNGRVCDLKFKNCYAMPIYLASRVQDNQLSVEVYGQPTGVTYSRESVVIEKIQPPPPEQVEGEEAKILRPEKEGVRSEGWLIVEKDGQIERKKIRTDSYKCVQGKEQIVKEQNAPMPDRIKEEMEFIEEKKEIAEG